MGAGTGGQYRAQGTDTFGNPQAPQSGTAVYNADGQSVGTGSTSGYGGGHTGSGSGYGSGNTGSGGGYTGSGSGNTGSGGGYTGSGRDTGSGPSLASVVPGTEAYKQAHVRGGDDSGVGRNQEGKPQLQPFTLVQLCVQTMIVQLGCMAVCDTSCLTENVCSTVLYKLCNVKIHLISSGYSALT